VRGIDIELVEAPKIVEHYALKNVQLTSADIYTAEFDERFDAVVAADVLEHFKTLEKPLSQIHRWLKDDGLLFTSLPTENFFTRFTRVLGRYTKPWDHYHSGEEVEEILRCQGFRKIYGGTILRLFPLYLIGVWEKAGGPSAYPGR
jgi:2-polyprenyl-3-methyl-5-hydroxy-6-metoxy-1,4-benzoquinol methylase